MDNSSQDMDCSYHTTPNRIENKISIGRKRVVDRALAHPYKCNVELNSTALAPGNILETMPLYTPPRSSRNITKNPFEQAWLLKEKLSQPTCSPSLFQKVISPINKNSTFSWSVDEISILRPAQIDENPSQEFTSWFSPDTESQAQAAIDRFFSSVSHEILESPVVLRDGQSKAVTVSCQTDVSYPPNLPTKLEEELNAIYNKIAAWMEDPGSLNVSNCSARRKLLSGDDDDLPSDDDDDFDASNYSINDQTSREPMFAATPVRRLLHSSPECSPIRPDNHNPDQSAIGMDISQIMQSPSLMEESGFGSHNSASITR